MTSYVSPYVPYIQLAMGVKGPEKLADGERKGYLYQAARTLHVARRYFLEQVSGLKQAMKMPGVVAMYWDWKGTPLPAGVPMHDLFKACGGAAKMISAAEVYGKFKGIFKPIEGKTLWQKVHGKAADIADWTMSATNTYEWLEKIGMVVARSWMSVTFNVASVVFLSYHASNEYTKWSTGHIEVNGQQAVFTTAHKVKSIFMMAILASYGTLTLLAFAEMAGITVAASTALTFTCLGSGIAFTVAQHFWEELVVKEDKPKTT